MLLREIQERVDRLVPREPAARVAGFAECAAEIEHLAEHVRELADDLQLTRDDHETIAETVAYIAFHALRLAELAPGGSLDLVDRLAEIVDRAAARQKEVAERREKVAAMWFGAEAIFPAPAVRFEFPAVRFTFAPLDREPAGAGAAGGSGPPPAAVELLRALPGDWTPADVLTSSVRNAPMLGDLVDLGLAEMAYRRWGGSAVPCWRRTEAGRKFLSGIDQAAFHAADALALLHTIPDQRRDTADEGRTDPAALRGWGTLVRHNLVETWRTPMQRHQWRRTTAGRIVAMWSEADPTMSLDQLAGAGSGE